MFRAPVETFAVCVGNGNGLELQRISRNQEVAGRLYADLRKFLVQIIERHIEKKLVTATMLAKL